MRLHQDTRGLVGKILVVWLLLVALVGVMAVDAASIAITTYRLSDTASEAATVGAAALRSSHGQETACDDARQAIETKDPDQPIGKAFCELDLQTETVTITLKARVTTIVAGRLSFTKNLTRVVVVESGRPSGV